MEICGHNIIPTVQNKTGNTPDHRPAQRDDVVHDCLNTEEDPQLQYTHLSQVKQTKYTSIQKQRNEMCALFQTKGTKCCRAHGRPYLFWYRSVWSKWGFGVLTTNAIGMESAPDLWSPSKGIGIVHLGSGPVLRVHLIRVTEPKPCEHGNAPVSLAKASDYENYSGRKGPNRRGVGITGFRNPLHERVTTKSVGAKLQRWRGCETTTYRLKIDWVTQADVSREWALPKASRRKINPPSGMSRKAQERRAGSSQTLPGSHSRAAKRGAPWRCRGAVVWVVVEIGGRPWSLVPRVKRWLWRRTNTDKIISFHTKPTISLTKSRRVISLHTKPTIRLTKTRRVISLHTKPTIRLTKTRRVISLHTKPTIRLTKTRRVISLHAKPTIRLTKTRRVISLHTKPTIRLIKTRSYLSPHDAHNTPLPKHGVISLHTKPTIRFYQNTESYLSPHQAHTTPLPSASPHSLSVTSTLEGGNVHFMHRARQGWYRTTEQQRLTSGKLAYVFNCTSTVTLEHVDYDHIGAFSEVHAPLPGVAAHDTSPVPRRISRTRSPEKLMLMFGSRARSPSCQFWIWPFWKQNKDTPSMIQTQTGRTDVNDTNRRMNRETEQVEWRHINPERRVFGDIPVRIRGTHSVDVSAEGKAGPGRGAHMAKLRLRDVRRRPRLFLQ